MERKDNYAISAAAARKLFLNFDPGKLAAKLHAKLDDDYLYTRMLSEPYRIHLRTADISRFHDGAWVDANSFNESLTLLDLVCDSREDRFCTMRWENMASFGLQFHQNLLEEKEDPQAVLFERDPEGFRRGCLALGGVPYEKGDIAYRIEVFDGLCLVLQLWFSDEDFPAQLRVLWDANAKMYLKYETMYYCLGLLYSRIREQM